jgi:hypothetical protein
MPYLDLDEENEIEEQAIIEKENGEVKRRRSIPMQASGHARRRRGFN